ncbi:hypothetical protein [Sphingomonas sp. UYAg733]
MQKFSNAARALLEKGFVDAAAGRHSRTLFISTTKRISAIGACALAAALEQGFSMVSLEFGETAKAKGPRCFSVALADGQGGADTTHDCALAIDAEGRHVLVPRGPVAATFHFAIGPNGVERRHGRPPNVAANAIKASRHLIAAARKATVAGCFGVHVFPTATAA